jgi:hypothetical protein
MTWTLLASEFRLKRFKRFSFLRIAAANFGLASEIARRGEASEIAKAIPRNRAKFELSRKADLLSSINAGQTTARRAGL